MLVAFAEHASLALTDAKTVEDAIHQAFHDSLTGLPNRQLLIDRLEHALARAARTGDARRRSCSSTSTRSRTSTTASATPPATSSCARPRGGCSACVRAADTAARFGGDEFVVLLEDVDDAARRPGRQPDPRDDERAVRGPDREVFIGASIGIAIGGDEADDLLRNADLALYRAKAKGKGQKQVFEPEMHVAMVERLELEGRWRRRCASTS